MTMFVKAIGLRSHVDFA